MISNYLKLAFRNLRHNRLFSFLNISGLAVGLASGIIVLLWITDEYSYDNYLPNLKNIYMVIQNQSQGGQISTFTSTPGPLARALKTELPEFNKTARTSWKTEQLLQHGDKALYEKGFYADPELFEIFKWTVLKGDPVEALKDAGSVVITERTAKKFFGADEPIGKTFRHNNVRDLKVAAVIADFPTNSTIRFDVALPFRIYEQNNQEWINSWGNNSLPTYAELAPDVNLTALNAKLEHFIQGKNPDAAAHIFAYPLSEWRLRSQFSNGKPSGGRIEMLQMLGVIGMFVLLIACINFMNLSTAQSEKRAREVGVRKSLGAQRGSLVGQFMGESLVIASIALTLALGITQLVLPVFNRVMDKSVSLATLGPWVIGGILLLGMFTGLIAGSYPSLFLSRFQPVKVLKGGVITQEKGNSLFRRGLVTFQFVISIFLIITTIVISRQIEHAQSRPIGYELTNLFEIPARGDMTKNYQVIKNEVTQIPGVTSMTIASDNLVRMGSNTSGIQWPGKTEDQDFLVTMHRTNFDWSKTVGAKIVEGRDFSPEFGSDSTSCILNQTAVRMMGLKEPVIGTVLQHDTALTVIGVVEDFVFNDPFGKPAPMIVYLDDENMSSFLLRLDNNDHWKQTLAQVEGVFKKYNPAYPIEPKFVRDSYQDQFEGIRSGGMMAKLFGGLAIFISCLGLFGLSAFTAERRKKEIGVRKVLGATIQNVLLHLSKDFLKPVMLAFVLASPLAYWAMEKLLTKFDYRIDLAWWMFVVSALVVLAIAAVTVSYQSLKAALTNPTQSLRSE